MNEPSRSTHLRLVSSEDWDEQPLVTNSFGSNISACLEDVSVLFERSSTSFAGKEYFLPGDVAIDHIQGHAKMNDFTREELSSTLSAIEERMDKRIERMERDSDKRSDGFKAELSIRDDQLRREIDLRQESFRTEQAARDAALSEKFAGFLSAQAERDRAWEKISEARFERIEKDIGSIKTDTKKVSDDVGGLKIDMAKYLGGAIVIGAIVSAVLGAVAKHLLG